MIEFLHHYGEIVSDPAHVAAELTFIVVIDGLILGLLAPLARRLVRREHNRLDREHGVVNHGRQS